MPVGGAADIHVRHMVERAGQFQMVDFGRARAAMVENQLRTSGVSDWRLLARMADLPRENFVPANRRDLAYVDTIHRFGPAASGRFMPAPATLAKLVQLGEIAPHESVLDVGAGTGYATAVVAGLAASVVGLEADAALAQAARDNLAALGVANATIVAGDVGAVGGSTFDVILVEGMVDTVPPALAARLADGGRLVVVLQQGGVGVANVLVRAGKDIAARAQFNVALPPLSGGRRDDEFVF